MGDHFAKPRELRDRAPFLPMPVASSQKLWLICPLRMKSTTTRDVRHSNSKTIGKKSSQSAPVLFKMANTG